MSNIYLYNKTRFTHYFIKRKKWVNTLCAYLIFICWCALFINIMLWSMFYLSTDYFVSVYGICVVLYYTMQLIFAEVYRRRIAKIMKFNIKENYYILGIQIVGYREDFDNFKACVESAINIDYQNKIIVVSIDGDDKEDLLMYDVAYGLLESSNCRYKILLNPHEGKRGALYHAYMYLRDKTDFVITTDSDSILPQEAYKLMVPMILNSEIIVTCGEVHLSNDTVNLLTRVLVPRYYVAFALERNAFSYVGSMNCASGPLGCYRSAYLRIPNILEKELRHQRYLWCKNCHVGDDRHMTVTALKYGKCLSVPYIYSLSESPTALHRFIVQQTRWAKSYHRETVLEIKSTKYHNILYCFFIAFNYTFSFLLVVYLVFLLLTNKSWWYLLISCCIMVCINILRSFYL